MWNEVSTLLLSGVPLSVAQRRHVWQKSMRFVRVDVSRGPGEESGKVKSFSKGFSKCLVI